jgi:hypothetical protein
LIRQTFELGDEYPRNANMSFSAALPPPPRTVASFMVLSTRNLDDAVLMRRLPSIVSDVCG